MTCWGARADLKHPADEIILSAPQANPADAKVGIRTETETNGRGTQWVHIDVQDNGAGFTPEAAKKVPEPFFTTRNVGLGLGLTVSRKIIETHRGKLVITESSNDSQATLPLPLPPQATSPAHPPSP